MTDFGGLGGIQGGRQLNNADLFEATVERVLGSSMRQDSTLAKEMWSALANVDWFHENGDTAGYSFRAAGDLVAAIMGHGDYMDWYCCGPTGRVSDRVADALEAEGWTYTILE